MAVQGLLVQAGKLDRRVTLRRLVEGRSPSHGVTQTAQPVIRVWAQKVPERGSEQFQEGQRQGWAAVTWRIRYLGAGVLEPTVKWELLEGQRVYEVLDVRELGRREGWELVTRTRSEDQVA